MAQQTPPNITSSPLGVEPFSGKPVRVKWEPPSYVEMFKRGLQLAQSMIPPGTRTLESILREAEMTGYYKGQPTVELQRLLEEKRYHDLWAQIQREGIAADLAKAQLSALTGGTDIPQWQYKIQQTAWVTNELHKNYQAMSNAYKAAKTPKEKEKYAYPLFQAIEATFKKPDIQEAIMGGADVVVALNNLVRSVAGKTSPSMEAYLVNFASSLARQYETARDDKKRAAISQLLRRVYEVASYYVQERQRSSYKGSGDARLENAFATMIDALRSIPPARLDKKGKVTNIYEIHRVMTSTVLPVLRNPYISKR